MNFGEKINQGKRNNGESGHGREYQMEGIERKEQKGTPGVKGSQRERKITKGMNETTTKSRGEKNTTENTRKKDHQRQTNP